MGRESQLHRHRVQVRPVVDDRYSVQATRLVQGRTLRRQPFDGRGHGFVGDLVGVELHRDAGVAGHGLPDVAALLQRSGQGDGSCVERGVELCAELGEDRGVTERMDADPHCGAQRRHVRSQEWRRTRQERFRCRGVRRTQSRAPRR